MGKGLLGLLKLHLIAKVQFCRFTTGPDLSNRGVFFKAALPSPDVKKLTKAALPSPDVEKCDQDGSAWVRVPRPPKTALNCKSSILPIHDRSGPVEQRRFFQSCSA